MPDSRVLIRLCSAAVGSLLMLATYAPSDVWARGGGGGGGHGGGGHSGHSTGSGYVNGYSRKDGTPVRGYFRHNGKMGTNRYPDDSTSPDYTGPDSDGQIGHANENASPGAPCVWNGTTNCVPIPLVRDTAFYGGRVGGPLLP